MKTLKCEICGASVEEEDGFDKSCVCPNCIFQATDTIAIPADFTWQDRFDRQYPQHTEDQYLKCFIASELTNKRRNTIRECISVLKENKVNPTITECIRQIELIK